jgi:hypothetical protein
MITIETIGCVEDIASDPFDVETSACSMHERSSSIVQRISNRMRDCYRPSFSLWTHSSAMFAALDGDRT